MRDQLRSGAIQSFKMEKRYLRKDGSPIWVGLTIACKRDRKGKCLYDISVVEDISSRKGAEERIQYLATHDGLTGLPNRDMFTKLLGLSIETARRYDRKLAVLFIDLDRFKTINDTYGHLMGDRVIRALAATLTSGLRKIDIVGRYGGEEFAVIMLDTSPYAARDAIEKQRRRFCAVEFEAAGQRFQASFSAGIASSRTYSGVEQIIAAADRALYAAKQAGRNRSAVDEPRGEPTG
jgi:diguanylate cyclase (GGDEF)-like protein